MKLETTDFTTDFLLSARRIAAENYERERLCVTCLPPLSEGDVPELERYANGFGVAAVAQDGSLAGYLCGCEPWDGAFGSTARATFSMTHGHGVSYSYCDAEREYIWRRLYQAAAEKWVASGVGYHALALYAHDTAAEKALFYYGFGMRCVDAMRGMDEVAVTKPVPENAYFREVPKTEVEKIRPLRRSLSAHLGKSPCFMISSDEDFAEWIARAESRPSRLFAAEINGSVAAFIEVGGEGENYASDTDGTANICGAYCVSEYRGGPMSALLDFTVGTLKSEGVCRVGVDFESVNPTALAFWSKHFTHYTHSLTRRIDECAVVL